MKFLATLSTLVILLSSHALFDAVYCQERISIPTARENGIELCSGDTENVAWQTDGSFQWDAPVGDRAVVALPLPGDADIENYGLGKVDIRIEGGPVNIMIFFERPGEKRMVWRPIDTYKPSSGWHTYHFDLAQPEIIRAAHDEPSRPRLAFSLWAMDTGYPDQERTRRITIRNLRLVKRRLDVRWNGIDYRIVPEQSGGLAYEYPVVVRNNDTVSRTIAARLESTGGRYGSGMVEPESAKVAPGDSARFTVRLSLPAHALDMLPPLYCEWFMPVFAVDGVFDSDEGILRSSDRITLPLIVMPQLRGPVTFYGEEGLKRMRTLYASTDWGHREGDAIVKAAERILQGDMTIPDGPGWARAYYYCHEHRCVLQYQGPDKHYCPVGGEYRSVDFDGVDLDRDYRAGEHNTVTGHSRTLALAFSLTGEERFAVGARSILAQYRDAYFTYDWLDLDVSTKTIDKGRLHFAKYMETYGFRSMIEALDVLKATGGIQDSEARDIEENLFLPALVEIADYRMDVFCRQATITMTSLLGGLFLNHPPLVAFAVRSPYGYLSLRRWGASADGIGHGHGYAQNSYTLHQLEMAELLYNCGFDTFDSELKRLADASYYWNVPMNPSGMSRIFSIAARHYPDPVYRRYAGRSIVTGDAPPPTGSDVEIAAPASVNFPNSGLSILRMPDGTGGTLDAEFKWGMPDNRGSFSVLSLGLNFYGKRCQSYPGHFHWGSTDLHHKWQIQTASHTTIVVDRGNQSGMKDYFKGHYMPHPSEQLFFEETGDYAATVAYNDRIYPGVGVWRAVLVLDGAYLVADLLRSDSPHTYDWWFHGVPDRSNGKDGIEAELRPRPEPLGMTDGYEMVQNLSSAVVNGDLAGDWLFPAENGETSLGLSMLVANDSSLEVVHGFEWSRQYSVQEKEFVVLRRENARDADYIVLLEPHKGTSQVERFERFDVTDTKGASVEDACGIVVELNGRNYEIILNPGLRAVTTTTGTTRKILNIISM